MDNYYKKYLKYKSKYEHLKNQIGGNQIKIIEDKYKTNLFQVKCFSKGFKQHNQECWNDSIMMFFCSQDELKETVQRKLKFLSPDEIINLAILRERHKNLPRIFDIKSNYDNMIIKIKSYLDFMKKRFNYYYNYYNEEVDKQVIPSDFTEATSPRLAIECATSVDGEQIFNTIFKGSSLVTIGVFNLLQCFLLDDFHLVLEHKNVELIKSSDLKDVIGSLNVWSVYNYDSEHVTCSYTCNSIKTHFDNNIIIPNTELNIIKNLSEQKKIEYIKNPLHTLTSVMLIKIVKTHVDISLLNTSYFWIEFASKLGIYGDSIQNDIEKLQKLISDYLPLGLDINTQEPEFGNLLQLGFKICENDLMYLLEPDYYVDFIKFLVKNKININLKNKDDDTIFDILYKNNFKKINDIIDLPEIKFYEVILNTDTYMIFTPLTETGLKFYSKGTKWYRSASGNWKFDKINFEKGRLYIIASKSDYNLKFIFQVETELLRNYLDSGISINTIKEIFKDDQLNNWFDQIWEKTMIDNYRKTNKLIIGDKYNSNFFNINYDKLKNLFTKIPELKSINFGPFYDVPLDNLLTYLPNLEKLTWMPKYSFGNSLKGLTKLETLVYYSVLYDDLFNGLTNLKVLHFENDVPLGDSLKYLIKLEKLYFGPEFNQALGDSLKYLTNLKELYFGRDFNNPLGDSLKYLTKLEKLYFGSEFDQLLEDSLKYLPNLKILNGKPYP